MNRFSERVWARIAPIYAAILDHPFNRELANGMLAQDRFAFYVQQDSLYLRDYSRSLSLLASRSPDAETAGTLLDYAKGGVAVEQELHGMMRETLKIPPASIQEPVCFGYTQFLLAHAALADYPVGLAAILPCFWIYRDVGLHIAQTSAADNPFAAWIQTYSDPDFVRITDNMIRIVDDAAAAHSAAVGDAMEAAFVRSSQYEWAFWDAAYQLTRWPVNADPA